MLLWDTEDEFPACSMYSLFCNNAVTLSKVMVSRKPCLEVNTNAKLGSRERTLSQLRTRNQACIVSIQLNIDKNTVV